jgi:type VI secretion system secreted protein VgrG
MSVPSQASTNPYRLSIDALDADFYTVESFTGAEAMSDVYSFEILAVPRSPSDDDVERVALGQRAVFIWTVGDTPRAFYGIVASVRIARAAEQQGVRHHIRVVPRLWLLKRKRRSRVFQNMRVPDLVTKVLLEAGIATRWQLTRSYPVREYCTQYEESDYRFVTRLLAEAGIYFYFAEGPPIDGALETASEIIGTAGAAAGSIVGSVAGSAVGSVVSDVAAAASPLVPGDTVICGDDAVFYPPIGADDPAALEAATIAALAPQVGEAIGDAVGGLDPVAGAALGAAGAVAGTAIGALTADDAPALSYLDMLGSATSHLDKITRFDLRTNVRANLSRYRDYDPDRPMARLETTALNNDPFPPSTLAAVAEAATTAGSMVAQFAPGPAADVGSAVAGQAGVVANAIEGLAGENPPPLLEVYEHHGPFLFPKWAFANDEAPKILRQKRRRVAVGSGVSGCPDLGAGRRFALTDHPVPHLDRPYVLTRVEHRGRAHFQSSAEAAAAPPYESSFECVPATMTYVPPRPRRKSVQVALTATVVGPAGSEIHVDEMGQIKVLFHWDRDGRHDESSCWIRTMHPWAGAGLGVQFIPRVGMEVVVTFEGGDPDKPLVLGTVYNGTHPPPFPLPGGKTRSGWRTQSSPGGGGFNELSFDDRAGGERVFLHAQKTLDEVVGADHTIRVGHDQSTAVGHDHDLVVAGNAGVKIGKGRNVDVGGDHYVAVKGAQSTSIEGGHSLHVGKSYGVMVGDEKRPASADFYSWGSYSVGAREHLSLSSSQGITLACGDTRLEITEEGVSIHGKNVGIQASESLSASGKGPSLVLDEQAQMTAKTIRMVSTKASLQLDGDAHLKGTQVKLNCDASEDDVADAPGPPPNTKKLQLQLSDPDFEPYTDREYLLTAGGRSFEGKTGGDGSLEEDVPEAATRAELLLFLGERPDGPKRRYAIALDDTLDAASPRGVQIRLRNLGYYWGPILDELDEAGVAALQDFQEDHGVSPTGKVDGETQAKLDERHRH